MAEPVHHQGSRRWGIWVLGLLAVVVVVVVLAEGLASIYTSFLWFHWTGVGDVWSLVVWTKVGLAAVFVIAAFLLTWVSLFLVDKIAPRALFMAPDTELVRRYQAVAGPHAVALRTVVSVLLGLALGAGTSTQWQHWILFEHSVPFGRTDPLFHLDDSFFVFRLPFLSFLVDWMLVALLVVLIVSAVAHFLNGAIRLQSQPRIEPRALAHLSLLLGAMALVRAWGYYYVDRYTLDLSSNGVVNGAGYTDVHVRLPAMTLLAIVSLVAFVLLVLNAYQRSVTLPVIAVGLWAFLALVVGVIYPAIIQAFKVNPSQSTLERPYITSNIEATQYAMGIGHVVSRAFPANQDLTPGVLSQYRASLEDSQLWDPSFVQPTFARLQNIWSYFRLSNLTVDRYKIGGKLTPVVISVRELNSSGAASRSWVNVHLQYTHGYGAVIAPSGMANASGYPQFALGNLPPTSSTGAPHISQPSVYFAPGEHGYVVADTTQAEVNFQNQDGSTSEGHYHGSGGIPFGSLLTRAAFAIHLKDFNLLISHLITSKSRLIYIPDIRSRVQKALPFLTVDQNPYPVIDHGQIDWMVDAYTTSGSYPYGQPAATGSLSPGSPLAGNYNYVRDAVKVVVNAYTGKMTFYVLDRADPLIRSYEQAFPGLFRPLSTMDPTLRAHMRYPQDLLAVQAAMYGRYHVTNASEFYSLSDAWDLSQTSTSANGSPSAPLPLSSSGSVARFSPLYELLQLPGAASPSFEVVEPFVPYSNGDQLQTLSALLFANSDASAYGHLAALVAPRGGIDGPGLANSDMLHDPAISQRLTLLDQSGSRVTLGTVQVLPIADSLLYVRPLYVSGSQTNLPQLVDVIILYGKQIAIEPTLSGALESVFGTAGGVHGTGVGGSATKPSGGATSAASLPGQVRRLVAEASSEYQKAEHALAHGQLGAYQGDVTSAGSDLAQAQKLLVASQATKPAATSPTGTKARSTTARRSTTGVVEAPVAALSGTPSTVSSTTVPRSGS